MALGKLDFPKFTKEYVLAGTLPATSTNYGVMFVADRPCILEDFDVRYENASTAAVTIQARKVASGSTITVAGSGNNMLAAGIALNGATATVISGVPVGAGTAVLNVGDGIALVPSGTPTVLGNLLARARLKYI